MKPFSTLVLQCLAGVFAASIKICTDGGFYTLFYFMHIGRRGIFVWTTVGLAWRYFIIPINHDARFPISIVPTSNILFTSWRKIPMSQAQSLLFFVRWLQLERKNKKKKLPLTILAVPAFLKPPFSHLYWDQNHRCMPSKLNPITIS